MKKTLIIIYPYKFTDFLWTLLELDEFKKHVNIQVWDISKIINAKFSNSISANNSNKNEILHITKISDFIRQIFQVQKKIEVANICFLNEIPVNLPFGFLCNFIFGFIIKGKGIKVFDLFNAGIPLDYKNTASISSSSLKKEKLHKLINFVIKKKSYKEIIFEINAQVLNLISRYLPKVLTHRLVAGLQWEKYCEDIQKKSSITLVKGHSHDYSAYLLARDKLLNCDQNFFESRETSQSVFLSSPNPRFASDSNLTQKKNEWTCDVWYPSLCHFLDNLEEKFCCTVKIAGHYKSKFQPKDPLFGGRDVIYGATQKLIEHSNFVISMASTATSFAVIYRKPLIFIYSNQVSKNLSAMHDIKGMAQKFGIVPINIDEELSIDSINLEVIEDLYVAYERDFLTSTPLGRPNFQIILEDIINIPN